MCALKCMLAAKVPGVDGFPVEFFTNKWNTVNDDVLKAVNELFQPGKILKSFSYTAITLIPKCSNPTKVNNYRPIACFNTFYNLITKIHTNRIKRVIDTIIGPS